MISLMILQYSTPDHSPTLSLVWIHKTIRWWILALEVWFVVITWSWYLPCGISYTYLWFHKTVLYMYILWVNDQLALVVPVRMNHNDHEIPPSW